MQQKLSERAQSGTFSSLSGSTSGAFGSLRQQIEAMIADDLTVGRTDAGRKPFTEVKIMEFITNNETNICNLINIIITEYADEIEETPNYEFECSQIREYFYEVINTGV
jgi:hypothetical protein